MNKNITITEYYDSYQHLPVIDVRSPGEYDKGHIPNAINIPLFLNEERAHIGTVYKQIGQKEAIELGYVYVNPKLQYYIDESLAIAPNKQVVIHCWRGGMRSAAFADHLRNNGFNNVLVIKGGYKSYRNYVLSSFDIDVDLKVIGGYTGSGKTKILKELEKRGEQVIDLEKIANHKGSAFGSIGEAVQPTIEQFENNLSEKWHQLNFSKPVFIEDESHNIGQIQIPMNLFNKIRSSIVYFLDIPKEPRAKLLVGDYAICENTLLEQAINKISRRLGGLNTKLALESLHSENYFDVAMITLKYYDKSYMNGLLSRAKEKIITIPLSGVNASTNAEYILNKIYNTK
ncbi:MAG: tRNA 2-selenouridine(34) synthase MnmH [Marinilabiliaceae bacterium]|nr:tRNA 2-selenouridine(34) synthase MnmH [Marinilabiliaceae bacterium]